MPRPLHRTHVSPLGRIQLIRSKRTGALRYVQRGGDQSTIDRHGVSVDTYVHALYGLMLQTRARRVLMIGCGGGALGTMLTRAGRDVAIVDVDPATFKLAKRHFKLPRRVRCHVADGMTFLETTRQRFDAIILDAFIGERIPRQFLGDAFVLAARRCLRERGVLLINVCLGRGQDTADRLAGRLARHGWRVRLLDRRRATHRNAIVMAGEVEDLRPPKLHIVPAVDAKQLKAELAAMYFRRRRAIKKR